MLENFINNFICTSLLGSIGIMLLIVLRKWILKKYTQNFIYYIWLIVIARLLMLFRLPIYISSKIYNMFGLSFNSIAPQEIKNKIHLYQSNANTTVNNYYNISIMKIMTYIWLLGVILITIHYVYTYLSLIRNIKNSTYDVNDDEIFNMYSELMCKLKINKKISLKYCDNINSPFGTGFLKPCIVIPSNCYNYKELKLILKHELIHFKKHDLLYKIALVAVKIFQWFNPLVYVMSKLIASDCELACDESLLKNSSIEERELYAITIINSLRFNKKHAFENGLITGFNSNKNILKRRFENMLNLKPKKRGVIIGVLFALIISCSLVSINVFAENNKTDVKPIIKKTSQVLYKGKAKDIPAKMINSNNTVNLMKEHPNEIVHVIEKNN